MVYTDLTRYYTCGDTVTFVGHHGVSRLWDVSSGEEGPAIDYSDELNSVAFSPDCKTMATGDDSGNVILWKLGQ
jgi:WD40 repeat protein